MLNIYKVHERQIWMWHLYSITAVLKGYLIFMKPCPKMLEEWVRVVHDWPQNLPACVTFLSILQCLSVSWSPHRGPNLLSIRLVVLPLHLVNQSYNVYMLLLQRTHSSKSVEVLKWETKKKICLLPKPWGQPCKLSLPLSRLASEGWNKCWGVRLRNLCPSPTSALCRV